MDDLRVALLIAGIAVVAGVYVFARFSRRNAAKRGAGPDFVAREPRREGGETQDRSASLDPHSMEGDDTGTGTGTGTTIDTDIDTGTAIDTDIDTGTAIDTDIDTGTAIDTDIGNLGGIFAPRRETSDAELSVDVSILAGLRATYESTLDGTVDGFAPSVPYKSTVDGSAPSVPQKSTMGGSAPSVPYKSTMGGSAPSVPHESTVDGSAPSAPHESTVDGSAPSAPHESTAGGADPPADPGAAAPLAIDMSRPLVYLTLVAKHERLSGRAILDALDAEGFRPGLMQLYYQRSEADPSVVVGVANMAEAGVLEPDSLPDMETPGLVTFTSVADDETHALKTFDMMVAASRRLAHRIDVTLCDETRSTLTAQAENHLRERVADIVRRGRMRDRAVPEPSGDAAVLPEAK